LLSYRHKTEFGTYIEYTNGVFVKIVAAPAGATLDDGVWYTADGAEIGLAIWGAFAIIEEVSNNKCDGQHGVQYVSPDRAGLGNWKYYFIII
jgi:hypothetical protein